MNTTFKNDTLAYGQIPFSKHFFDGFLLPKELFTQKAFSPEEKIFVPQTNISEDDNAFYITIALAGFQKEDLQIETFDNQLTISGKRDYNKEEKTKNAKTHLSEIAFGQFKRQFKLPKNTNDANIEAHFTNGLLDITITKRTEQVQKNKINIL